MDILNHNYANNLLHLDDRSLVKDAEDVAIRSVVTEDLVPA